MRRRTGRRAGASSSRRRLGSVFSAFSRWSIRGWRSTAHTGGAGPVRLSVPQGKPQMTRRTVAPARMAIPRRKQDGDTGDDFSSLSVGPFGRRAGIPRPPPSQRGAAPGPSGRRDHGGRRQGPGGGQLAGLAAMRWTAAASAASGQREIPTYSASLLHPAHGLSRPRCPATLPARALQRAQSAC
jgi:hypothetical protein